MLRGRRYCFWSVDTVQGWCVVTPIVEGSLVEIFREEYKIGGGVQVCPKHQ